MSDRIELLRQQARAEAAERERARAAAGMIQTPKFCEPGRSSNAAYGETPCPRCGVRSGVGCAHRPAGDTRGRLSAHDVRRRVL